MIGVAILFMDLRYEPDVSSVQEERETSVEEQVKRERDAQVIAESIAIIRKVSSFSLPCSVDWILTLRRLRSDGLVIVQSRWESKW